MTKEIEKKVIDIVKKSISSGKTIDINTSSENNERWDSLAQIRIITLLENQFSNIKTSDIEELKSVTEIIKYLKK